MDTMKDTTMQHVTDVVIEEAKLAAEFIAGLFARIEQLESDIALKERIIDALGVTLTAVVNERDALRTALQHETDCLEAAKEKIDALCARIEEMEKQEPIGTTGGMPGTTGFTMACFHADKVPIGSKLYALPGAKGESE